MTVRTAVAGLTFGLAAVLSAPLAFAAGAQAPPIHYVVDLSIDYFAGGIVGPPIFPGSVLTGLVRFYVAGPDNLLSDTPFAPFLQAGPPIDIGEIAVGQRFSAQFIPGNPVDIARLGFSFGGDADGFAAHAFAFPSDIPQTNPETDPILTVLQNGPPIDVLLQGPPIRTSGAIFAYDAPVQVGVWSASVSAAADVPEPATWAMLIAGFAGAGLMLRRARRAVTV